MEEEKEKHGKKLKKVMLALAIGIVPSLYFKFDIGLSWILSIAIGIIIIIILLVLNKLGYIKEIDNKERDKQREKLKKYSREELKNLIKEGKDNLGLLEKELSKRPIETIPEKLSKIFWDFIEMGIPIIILGIIYLGSVAPYFGVNDEFRNPTNLTNPTLGLNGSLNLVYDIGYDIIDNTLMQQGRNNPTLWFWLFWFVIFMTYVFFPVIGFIWWLYKRRREEIKNMDFEFNGASIE